MAAVELTLETFEEKIKGAEIAVVDFWATWCGPCQMQGPIIEQFSEERTDVAVFKVNVDDAMALAQKFQVVSIPTLVFFKQGEVVKTAVGLQTKDQIEAIVNGI